MVVGQLAEAIIKVLDAKKELDKLGEIDYYYRYNYAEYCNLEDAEKELMLVIKKQASDENE